MALPTQGVPSVKKKPREGGGRITIMFIRSVGRVRSFKISSHIVIGALVFFLLYISGSIIVINGYLDLRHRNSTQSKKIEHLGNEIYKSKKVLVKSKQHIALLEDYIYNLEDRQEKEGEPVKEENLQAKSPAQSVTQPVVKEEPEKKPAKLVDIRDMVIQKERSRMTVTFNLVNIQPGENAVGGYIHIIAAGKQDNPPEGWTYPKEKLKNGMPINFRRGLLFLIQRFKPIRGKINLSPNSEQPTSIKILVYDQAGALIVEKRFEVSNVS